LSSGLSCATLSVHGGRVDTKTSATPD
jgi:hypothetical protein